MSKIKIYDMKGSEAGNFDIADSLLVLDGAGQAVHEAVTAYMAGQRAGTASTLRKGEVAGSNRKPWKQKGTGRARAGCRRSPIWRGGGVAFGPHPRSYEKKVNKEVSRLAFKRVLSEKIKSGAVKIIDELTATEIKTKQIASLLKSLGVKGSALFIMNHIDRKIAMSARNIPDVEVARAQDVGIYQLLRHSSIIADKAGMEVVRLRLDGGNAEKQS